MNMKCVRVKVDPIFNVTRSYGVDHEVYYRLQPRTYRDLMDLSGKYTNLVWQSIRRSVREWCNA